jgi:ectoine hydroxylase-related dioxygenase (phytanoyl-CoA dioxygenase family)
MNSKKLSAEQVAAFERDGYVIVRNYFAIEEANKLYQIAIEDDTMKKHSYDLNDQTGKKTKLALWFTPGNDTYGLLTKSERMVHGVDQLLEGDSTVCHIHTKLIQNEPKVGGAWERHQDYGYCYNNEFLLPDQMISVMVAITEATKENGCLQVIKGSHKMGRIEHGFAGEQVGASQHYVDLSLKTMELVYVELMPGDTLFFHSNLLHRSEVNLSDKARWSLISCYNRASNIPYNETSNSCITPLSIVPDNAIMEWEAGGLVAGLDFLSKESDLSLK